MINMIQDMTDIFARDHSPLVVSIVENIVNDTKHGFSAQQRKDMTEMVAYLKNFDGKMEESSVSATVYSYWQYFFYRSLFMMQSTNGPSESLRANPEVNKETGEMEQVKFWDLKRRIVLGDNYAFTDYFNRLIVALSKGQADAG